MWTTTFLSNLFLRKIYLFPLSEMLWRQYYTVNNDVMNDTITTSMTKTYDSTYSYFSGPEDSDRD